MTPPISDPHGEANSPVKSEETSFVKWLCAFAIFLLGAFLFLSDFSAVFPGFYWPHYKQDQFYLLEQAAPGALGGPLLMAGSLFFWFRFRRPR